MHHATAVDVIIRTGMMMITVILSVLIYLYHAKALMVMALKCSLFRTSGACLPVLFLPSSSSGFSNLLPTLCQQQSIDLMIENASYWSKVVWKHHNAQKHDSIDSQDGRILSQDAATPTMQMSFTHTWQPQFFKHMMWQGEATTMQSTILAGHVGKAVIN